MSSEEVVSGGKEDESCFLKRKSAKMLLQAFFLTLSIVVILGLFSIPVAFVIVEVSYVTLHDLYTSLCARSVCMLLHSSQAVTCRHGNSQGVDVRSNRDCYETFAFVPDVPS